MNDIAAGAELKRADAEKQIKRKKRGSSATEAGFLAGSLSVPFIEWVLANAESPVKLALRGAEPIAYVAGKLSKMRPEKFGAAAEWQSVYITKRMSNLRGDLASAFAYESYNRRRLEEGCGLGGSMDYGLSGTVERISLQYDAMSKYFLQCGLGDAWTLADTGLSGTMAEDLGEFGPCKSLFFASIGGGPRVSGFINQPQYQDIMDRAVLPAFKESRVPMVDACWRITDFMDAMPKEAQSPSGCRIADDGRAEPVLVPEDPEIRVMRSDYIVGLKNAVRAYDKEKLPSIGRVLDELFSGGTIDKYIGTLTGRQR
ncbi:MAG: hypothetical protein LBL21_02100 [Rickettsiales bacterium]|jgi:hypothetical protein|nr:hypothetical protein [Rickettsiales bacterium]